MGQKANPTGFRTGVTLGWKSRWFAPKSNYGEFLVEDARIRTFLDNRLNRQPPFAAVSAIEIERTREEVKVVLKTARPGIVIGPKGAEVDALKNALEDLTDRRVNINIVEINEPDLDAQLIAEGVSEQLKRRSSFRRTIKQRAEAAVQAGAKGVKIQVSGRLGGAEMCRTEDAKLGSVPLHTLEADVDYGYVPCFTNYGAIGVKVWVYRGLFSEQQAAEEAAKQQGRRRSRRTSRGPSRRPVETARIQPAKGGASGGDNTVKVEAPAKPAPEVAETASNDAGTDSE
ncbi:MAG: 30S ribosomal protein S3 [Planctomycetes bacterium]|jgi:small subunit ribosomal protein S3|nr:30S ribosomal protein S3 [Phycisphaerae bacterium]NBB96070.1 30S ribosomal protein S3 [Planctomycetota bacterium]